MWASSQQLVVWPTQASGKRSKIDGSSNSCLTSSRKLYPRFVEKILMVQLNHAWESIFNLFFPPQCVHCQSSGALLCPTCAQQASPPINPVCERCGRMQTVPCTTCNLCLRIDDWALTQVRAATLYAGPIQAAVQALKYEGQRELARSLARYLVVAFHQQTWLNSSGLNSSGLNSPGLNPATQIDFAIPVPLHKERYHERGYNQAQLIAEAFGHSVHIPIAPSFLTRTRYSESQVNLQFNERQENVKDAFQATADLSGKRILLIDDVYTTGATLNECAKTLRKAGAIDIYGLTLAMPSR